MQQGFPSDPPGSASRPRLQAFLRRRRVLWALPWLVTLSFVPDDLHAEPDPTAKGITGGALLGAELTVFGEAIAGLETPWFYWLGAGLGAVGGGLGGYYVETSGAPRSSYYLLAGGMALGIPATVVYLDATNEARRTAPQLDTGPNYDEEPFDEPEQTLRSTRRREMAMAPGVGILQHHVGWRLRPPTLRLDAAAAYADVAELSTPGRTRVTLPLVSGTF